MDPSIILDPIIQDFVSGLDTSTPISSLPIKDARDLLRDIQDIQVEIPDVNVESHIIHIEGLGNVPFKIVRPNIQLNKLLPIIMYFHGGGWILGDFEVFRRFVSQLAYYNECAVVFVEYTPSPEAIFPTPLYQSYYVTEYISYNANHYGLDGNELVVAGDSVGGNMAIGVTLLAKQNGIPNIKAQVLFYPVTDDNFQTESYIKYQNGPWLTLNSMNWFWNTYAPPELRDSILLRPLHASLDDLSGLPRALIITAENDVLRDEGEAFARKLIQAGVDVLSIRYLGAIHDFMMLNGIASSFVTRSALSNAIQFIKYSWTQ